MTALTSTDRPLTAGDVALLREGDTLHARGLRSFRVGESDTTSIGYIEAAVAQGTHITFVSRPAPVPEAGEGVEPVAWPEICDGEEQPAFEAWAAMQRFDMNEHPLHYLFMDPRTDAARQGWKAGLEHAVARMKAVHPAPTDRVAELEAALREARDAVDFFDRVKDSTRDEQIAVGRDHWNRMEAALRSVALLSAQPRAKGEG